jgi:hypothetical protein
VGTLLIDRFLSDLRATNAKGVHVFCGPDPVRFYKSVGFEELDHVDIPDGRGGKARVFALGLRL